MGSIEKSAAQMRKSWNERAEKNAFHYVETNHEDGDLDAFFALGEERARIFIDPVLPASRGRALDVGCGLGRMSRALSRRFDEVVGVDVSDSMVDQARALNTAVPNVSFVTGTGLAYPVPDASFDFVFSYEVFQHMPDHDVVARNVTAVGAALKPGGQALIHLKASGEEEARPKLSLSHRFPAWALAPAKRLLGRDPLKIDETYRGAAPLSLGDIGRMFEAGGMEIADLRPDPTHEAGARVFVHATRRGARNA